MKTLVWGCSALGVLTLLACSSAPAHPSGDRQGCAINDFWASFDRASTALLEKLARDVEAALSKESTGWGPYVFEVLRRADDAPSIPPSAGCAYPAEYRPGAWTFIIDEEGTLFKRDLGRPGPADRFPDEADLERDWRKAD